MFSANAVTFIYCSWFKEAQLDMLIGKGIITYDMQSKNRSIICFAVRALVILIVPFIHPRSYWQKEEHVAHSNLKTK